MQPIVTGGTDSDSEGEEEDGDDDDDDDDDDEVEPPKVLGDILESLAGAVFMDSGMDLQAVWSCLGPLFEEKIGEIDRPEYLSTLLTAFLKEFASTNVH